MDSRTLLVSEFATLLLYAVVLGLLSFSNPRVKGLRCFFWAQALMVVKTALQAWRGSIPDVLSVLTANALVIVSFYVVYRGIRRFVSPNDRYGWRGQALLATALLAYVFVYSYGSLWDFAVAMVPVLVLCIRSIAVLRLNRDANLRAACQVLSAVLAAHAGLLLFRIVLITLYFGSHRLLSRDLFLPASAGSMVLLMLVDACLVACFVWLFVAELHGNLARLAHTDALTGVLNRRALEMEADRELARSARSGSPLAVLMLDIDHFKKLNDAFGHAAGDGALCSLVNLVKQELRNTDVVARFGGEEFIALLPDTDLAGAQETAERLRQAIHSLRTPYEHAMLQFTVSIGVAQAYPDDTRWEMLLHRADKALYEAKAAGRNRVATQLVMKKAMVAYSASSY